MRAVITDFKKAETNIVSATDYYPFGMVARTYTSPEEYRYGFNGQEKDNENFEGAYDFGARTLDVRLGRWLSVDPYLKSYPYHSAYCFSLNNPLYFIDKGGNYVIDANKNRISLIEVKDADGKITGYQLNPLNDFTGREKEKAVYEALLKTDSGTKALKRILDMKKKVEVIVHDEELSQGHAYTTPVGPIKIHIGIPSNDFKHFSKEAFYNIVATHEILGHLDDAGNRVDESHTDPEGLDLESSTLLSSSAMADELNNAVEYMIRNNLKLEDNLPVLRYIMWQKVPTSIEERGQNVKDEVQKAVDSALSRINKDKKEGETYKTPDLENYYKKVDEMVNDPDAQKRVDEDNKIR